MASKVQVLLLLVLLNVLFCTLVSAGHSCNNCGGSDFNNGGDGGNGGNGGNGGGSSGGNNGGGGGGFGRCPSDIFLRLGVCANLLGPVVGVGIGIPPTQPCCSLIAGLVDIDAALCLCTAIRANVLGILNLDVYLALRLILNNCGRNLPTGFIC